ncbi:hypothetical protein T08_16691 [Trichinella sp. T8]|nr:hypothetical protein T08_16691 [Trichinella sp. T8]
MQADRETQRIYVRFIRLRIIRGTHSVDSSERRVNIYKTGRKNSTRNRWLLKRQRVRITSITSVDNTYAARVGSQIYRARPPMSGSLKATMVTWRARPSGGFFKYFVDAQLTQWRKQPLSSTQRSPINVSAGVYLTPVWAARCRDNDLADGVRVLSSSYPRLSSTSPWPGHTD